MALRDQPYFPLYVDDYLTDEKLNMCSAESQGVYIKLLCLFHKSENYGGFLFKQNSKQNLSIYKYFVSTFTKLLPFDYETIDRSLTELLAEKVLFLDENCIYQKRMAKDGKTSLNRSKSAKIGGGNPLLKDKKHLKIKENNNENLFKQNDKQNTVNVNVNEYVNKDIINIDKKGENIFFENSENERPIGEVEKIKPYTNIHDWHRTFHENQIMIERICMQYKYSKEKVLDLENEFNKKQISLKYQYKNESDYLSHFENQLKFKSEKTIIANGNTGKTFATNRPNR